MTLNDDLEWWPWMMTWNDDLEWWPGMMTWNDDLEWWPWMITFSDDLEWWHWMMTLNDDLEWWPWMMTLNDDLEWWSWVIILSDDLEWWSWVMTLNDDLEWWYCLFQVSEELAFDMGCALVELLQRDIDTETGINKINKLYYIFCWHKYCTAVSCDGDHTQCYQNIIINWWRGRFQQINQCMHKGNVNFFNQSHLITNLNVMWSCQNYINWILY